MLMTDLSAYRAGESSIRQRRRRVRRLALSGNQRRLRDHGRRVRGDQGAGHRPVREAIPRRRVRCARLRLPPSRGERRPAAPGRAHRRAARRLAGRDRVRRDPAGSRPGQARDLGLLCSPAATSSASRRATRGSRRRSRRRRTPTARPPRATRRATRSRSRCCASPAGASSTRSAAWSAARRCWCRSPASRGPSRCSRRRTPSTATERSTRTTGTRTGSRRSPPARRSHRLLPARPRRVPGAVPAAGPRLRPGSDGAGRAGRRRGAARSPRRARPDARRALRAVPGRHTSRPSRPSCPSCAGTCSITAAGPARAADPHRTGWPGMKQIELSAGTIEYEDTGGDGPGRSCCCTG